MSDGHYIRKEADSLVCIKTTVGNHVKPVTPAPPNPFAAVANSNKYSTAPTIKVSGKTTPTTINGLKLRELKQFINFFTSRLPEIAR